MQVKTYYIKSIIQKIDAIFLNSKIVNFLNLNLTDKTDLKRAEKSVALSNPSIYYK